MKLLNILACGVLASALFSCDTDEAPEAKVEVKVETISDLPANPSDAPSANYTFFSFEDGVLSAADSASSNWDLAFRSTTILVNGGNSGPGSAQAGVVDGVFSDFTEVPASLVWSTDSETAKAIPTGSGNGWYSYNPTNHQITPLAGKVIFVKDSDGNYAKVEILSYYKGAPATPGADAVGRYYTFRYAYQPDGTTSFE
ncbi:HmuY family protein [Jiulongibacter sp. NS-SX5]|uniref:HmuY family protein n=1 Tax=Jiulongibacter sp. NS-SX5 TaxID=3463854 RepID=UPI004057E811